MKTKGTKRDTQKQIHRSKERVHDRNKVPNIVKEEQMSPKKPTETKTISVVLQSSKQFVNAESLGVQKEPSPSPYFEARGL